MNKKDNLYVESFNKKSLGKKMIKKILKDICYPFYPTLLMILIIILSVEVLASDKSVLSIPYCYNVSVDCDLMQGNYTHLSFRDCSKINGIFNCDCRDRGTFNLTMQTDSKNLDAKDWRYYKCSINYNTYTLDNSEGDLLIVDYGGGWNIKSNGIEYQGQNTIEVHDIVYKDRLVQINNTKYVDNIIYVEHNNTLYVENTSRLDGCNLELNGMNLSIANLTKDNLDLNKSIEFKNNLLLVLGCLILFGIIFVYSTVRHLFVKH